jgi:ABC-type transport system involved in multi-copper enzyme maturation permease subunit
MFVFSTIGLLTWMNFMFGFPSILDFKFSFTASFAIGFNIVTGILHDYIYAKTAERLQFLNKKPLRHSGHNLRGESSSNEQG